MSKKNYLIFDYGASNGRAAVASFDGSRFEMEVTHRFENRPVFAGGTLYWDILQLFSELKIGIQSSSKKYSDIISMGVDAWGSDFGLLDNKGKLISNPVNYRDEQSGKDSVSLFEVISQKELWDLTGACCIPIFDLFQLYSLKINDSIAIKNARTYQPITDIFNYFLTGKTVNEFTRFTTSILYNQKAGKIEDSIFKKLDLPRGIFPKMVFPGEKIGDISREVTEELGIETFPVIAPSTHDTAAAVAGTPVIDNKKNWAFMSLGTWACMGLENYKVLISDEIFDAGFFNEAGVEDTNLFVKNINGLWVIQQCRGRWVKDKEISWDEIVRLSKKAGAFTSLIDVEESQFIQPQTDMPQIIRNYCKKTGQKEPGTIGEVARCVYESLAFKFKFYLSPLERFTGKELELIHLVGGGTQNRLLCQWISNAMGLPVIAGPTETTSVGNLLMQLKADGEIKNIAEGRKIIMTSSEVIKYEPCDTKIWNEEYQKYLKIIKSLK